MSTSSKPHEASLRKAYYDRTYQKDWSTKGQQKGAAGIGKHSKGTGIRDTKMRRKYTSFDDCGDNSERYRQALQTMMESYLSQARQAPAGGNGHSGMHASQYLHSLHRLVASIHQELEFLTQGPDARLQAIGDHALVFLGCALFLRYATLSHSSVITPIGDAASKTKAEAHDDEDSLVSGPSRHTRVMVPHLIGKAKATTLHMKASEGKIDLTSRATEEPATMSDHSVRTDDLPFPGGFQDDAVFITEDDVPYTLSAHDVLRTLPLQPGTRRQAPSFKLGIRIPILSGRSAPPYQRSLAAPHHLSLALTDVLGIRIALTLIGPV
ncbi:hypothetical protein DENSPDRAFT_855399 [Dentipellis sp. KUC8613]|nr:hypothetical protein DENSPDRAFT_855399 [Dentipellis sp. KUC8613]